MIRTNVEGAVRFLRHQRGWRQQDLGVQAELSREMISRIERGKLTGVTLDSLDKVVDALGASVHIQIRWHGEQLDRLMDAAHAGIQQSVAELLLAFGWIVRVEVSFNDYGDRGRVDILAFHPVLRILLVIEIKSAFGDLQETLGRLDVKCRVGRKLARELEWGDMAAVIPVLVIGESRTARRTMTQHAALFQRYRVRGRSAIAWLRTPSAPTPAGLLWFANRTDSHQVTATRGKRVAKRSNSHVA